MTAVAIIGNIGSFDLALAGADLQTDAGLDTAVILSLFCDARADATEIAPGADPRGWWADALAAPPDPIGSKLWLLRREKRMPDVAARAQEYAQAALAWLVDDGVASRVDVSATFPAAEALVIAVAIFRPGSGTPFERRYQYVWSAYK
jgi:phage gp46-like protein